MIGNSEGLIIANHNDSIITIWCPIVSYVGLYLPFHYGLWLIYLYFSMVYTQFRLVKYSHYPTIISNHQFTLQGLHRWATFAADLRSGALPSRAAAAKTAAQKARPRRSAGFDPWELVENLGNPRESWGNPLKILWKSIGNGWDLWKSFGNGWDIWKSFGNGWEIPWKMMGKRSKSLEDDGNNMEDLVLYLGNHR